MRKASALFIILFMIFSVPLFAQDNSEPEVEPDWDDFRNELYTEGDQTFSLSLGVGFPIAFINNGEKIRHNITPPVGGAGAISYVYYFNSRLFTGGEISLLFLPTVAENTLFITSFGIKAGTQFIFRNFEFPVSMALGASFQTYLDKACFGFFMKAGVYALYRVNHEWSVGLGSNFCWYPEWTNEPAKNVDGLFVDLSLVGRYHF